jgi:hypothetical protein
MASEPLVIPVVLLSLEKNPAVLPAKLSFQYCKIITPEAMNRADPINEKKRSVKKGKL